ncbi:4'-phosphopantetheinyl transferase family protein [Streptomyces sp. NPDC052415]|uniref:4'-phosphopantetheinyl transferase family protein n=1 Tax=Streptomyces sp. NPDC052415 TaxID=3365690 RepID=UPI0037D57D39
MQYEHNDGLPGFPPGPGRPHAGAVEVWRFHATPAEVEAAERMADLLDPEERRRAAAFRRPADRGLYLVSHVGLRVLLGARLGLAPVSVELRRAACPLCGGPHGRPEVTAAPDLHFSLSHAHGLALCALAGTPVGVDVEAAASVPDLSLVPHLHPAERVAIGRLPESRRADAFLQCWVRKEAYLKGIGTGLGIDPATVHVGLGARDDDTALEEPDGWRLATVAVPLGHAAAVALQHPDAPAVATRVASLASLTSADAV